LPEKIEAARKDLEIAQRRRDEAMRALEETKREARSELLSRPAVRRAVAKARRKVTEAARKLAEANRDGLALEQRLIDAGLANYRPPFGDVPEIAIGIGADAETTQARLLAVLARFEAEDKAAA
jgi:hypothetical protein